MKPKPPSPRMLDAARKITALTREHGYPPTFVELAAALGVTHARARDLVHKGRDRGLFEFKDGAMRTVRVVDQHGRTDRGA